MANQSSGVLVFAVVFVELTLLVGVLLGWSIRELINRQSWSEGVSLPMEGVAAGRERVATIQHVYSSVKKNRKPRKDTPRISLPDV